MDFLLVFMAMSKYVYLGLEEEKGRGEGEKGKQLVAQPVEGTERGGVGWAGHPARQP